MRKTALAFLAVSLLAGCDPQLNPTLVGVGLGAGLVDLLL